MKSSVESIYFYEENKSRVNQGDIYRDVKIVNKIFPPEKEGDTIKYEVRNFPYLVVLSQDCDLLNDVNCRASTIKNQDKYLQSILVSPAYHFEQFKGGTHLDAFGMKMDVKGKDTMNEITRNQVNRYHYLNTDSEKQVPELVIDFKHYYAFPREYVYQFLEKNYLVTIDVLFRESLSQRFANYLCRVGLPNIQK